MVQQWYLPHEVAFDLETLVKHFPQMNYTTPKQTQFLIGSWTKERGLSVSANPTYHDSAASLRKEMERLAKLNPGTTYVALTVGSSVVAGGVTWS